MDIFSSGETTTCRSLQALQRKFGDWSLWCVFSSLGPSFWSLFLGATGFGREVVDSFVLKEMYPDILILRRCCKFIFLFFLRGVRSSLKFLGYVFFVGRTHGCTHHVTTPRQLGETLKAHFVVSPFGMWQKEDKMKKESTQIMDCSTFFRCFWIFFRWWLNIFFYFHPYLEKIPTSQKVMSCSTFFSVFLNQLWVPLERMSWAKSSLLHLRILRIPIYFQRKIARQHVYHLDDWQRYPVLVWYDDMYLLFVRSFLGYNSSLLFPWHWLMALIVSWFGGTNRWNCWVGPRSA